MSIKKFDNETDERRYYEHDASYDEWMQWYHNVEWNRYEHTGTTVDSIMLTYDRNESNPRNRLKVLLIQRWTHPFKDEWCLPGTFMSPDDMDATATIARMLRNRLNFNVHGAKVMQLKTFTGKTRDPRGQIVSISHLAFIHDGVNAVHNADIEGKDGLKWIPLLDAADMKLAFDHNRQILEAISRLRNQFAWEPNVFHCLPVKFTIDDALALRSSLFNEPDVRGKARENFKRKYKHVFNEIGVVNENDPLSPKIYTLIDGALIV